MIKHTRKQHTSSGFTLVETLVAITILLVVIVGPMTAAHRGIQQSYFSNEQITATFIAQEAAEAMRELRDEYGLAVLYDTPPPQSDDWINTFISGCSGPNGCMYNKYATSDPFVACSTIEQCSVELSSSGEYTQGVNGNGETAFSRFIRTSNDGDGNIHVTVEVSWSSGLFTENRTVVLQTWIYDQYRRYE